MVGNRLGSVLECSLKRVFITMGKAQYVRDLNGRHIMSRSTRIIVRLVRGKWKKITKIGGRTEMVLEASGVQDTLVIQKEKSAFI